MHSIQKATALIISMAVSAASGCAVKNPAWLDSPTTAFCASGLSDSCIKKFAEKAYTDATAKQVEQRKIALEQPVAGDPKSDNSVEVDQTPQISQAKTKESAEGQGGRESETPPLQVESSINTEAVAAGNDVLPVEKLPDTPPVAPKSGSEDPSLGHAELNVQVKQAVAMTDPISSLVFGVTSIGAVLAPAPGYEPSDIDVQSSQAGALLHLGEGDSLGDKLGQAESITDPVVRAAALGRMLTLYSRLMTEVQINRALNSLYDLDKDVYNTALIIKLPGLLNVGDLERAKSLRNTLLEAKAKPDRPFSMLGYVASCYTMAGMGQDAGEIIRESVTSGMALSPDDAKLIGMAISVANGSYPLMQEFYDYRSDEVRLHAYITIAVIARQLDRPDVAHRAVSDAVKFIQKSSVKIDRQRALSQILAVTPGVID